MTRLLFYFKVSLWLLLLTLSLSSCSNGETPLPISTEPIDQKTPFTQAAPTNSPIPIPATDTPIPIAISVNGFTVTQGEYQAELALYKEASGTELATGDEERVLNDLIDQALLAQAAHEKGFVVNDSILQRHLEQITEKIGGMQALKDWMAAYGYSEVDFHKALSRSIAAAWMRDQVIDSVLQNAEQIHARQILLLNPDQADEVFEQLQAGNDFYNLALEYDPMTAGDLGWFPKGYLPFTEIEEAAFNLEPGEYSAVIETIAGYHIVQVVERDPERQLVADALKVLQMLAIQDWLKEKRNEAAIQVYVP